MSRKKIQKLFGFTLLELLVVIGIIAVLVGLSTVSYSTAQKKSRDAKRKEDLRSIHNALEQYYAICGYQYPTPVSDANGNYYASVICPTPTQAIMPTVPTDPKGPTPYYCNPCNANEYKICANLESEVNPFCVSNSQ